MPLKSVPFEDSLKVVYERPQPKGSTAVKTKATQTQTDSKSSDYVVRANRNDLPSDCDSPGSPV